jgi:Homeodomain-like domain
MHPPETKQKALDLIAQGVNDCEVSRRLGVPRRTVNDWHRAPYERGALTESCPRCWRATRPLRFSAEDYAELLALYLGDGNISNGPRAQRLRLYLDARYPVMNSEIRALLERCFPANRVELVKPAISPYSGRSDSWQVLGVYSTHLVCLFPQHGRGVKHKRPIVLEHWQEDLVPGAVAVLERLHPIRWLRVR